MGFKAPLAYSSSFYFVCRKDGMERKYMMYEGEDTNTIDLLYEKETTEVNGVKIIIPVKYQDRHAFMNKIKEQLCYFESVYFDVPEDYSITNEFVISRHPDFQFSEMSTDNNIHICLDNVYYPLDFDKLGINRIQFPVALRFSLSDGLFPTPNRESLRYTQEAKKIILDKLTKMSDYFVTKYNAEIAQEDSLRSMINHIEGVGSYIKMENGRNQKIDELLKFSKIQPIVPKIEGVTKLDFISLYRKARTNILNNAYVLKFSMKYRRVSSAGNGYYYSFTLADVVKQSSIVYLYSDKLSQLKKDYIKSITDEHKQVFFIKPNEPMKLGKPAKFDMSTYYHLLELGKRPKNEWRQLIKDYQHIVSLMSTSIIDLDEINVPTSFIDSRKKQKTQTLSGTAKRLKLQGEIVCKKGVELLRYSSGRNCKFDSQLYKLEDLHKAKHLKVYSKHDDYLNLDSLYGVMTKQKMEVITLSDRELKIVDQLDIHNLISFDKFMEGKTAPFKRIVTSTLINNLMIEYRHVFEKSKMIGYTSSDLASKLDKLSSYRHANYMSTNDELFKAMLAVAEQNNLFDPLIYPEYLEMKNILDKLTFLSPLCRNMGYYSYQDEMVSVMSDLFKYYKHKVNLNQYKIKLNEETITEETIVQLT